MTTQPCTLTRDELKNALRAYRCVEEIAQKWDIKLNAKTTVLAEQYEEITRFVDSKLNLNAKADDTDNESEEAEITVVENESEAEITVVEDESEAEITVVQHATGAGDCYIKPSDYWGQTLSGLPVVTRQATYGMPAETTETK